MPTSYDQVLYPSHARKESHPVRLATMAKLAGLDPAPLESCSVLELGCGDGCNLIPMAYDYPGSRCVGMDLASLPLEAGRMLAGRLGLQNIEFVQGDLTTWDAPGTKFDYIIAHGVFSWVPEAARQGLLRICKRHLAPQGVAFVSYNAMPGCYFRKFVWDLMKFHTRGIADPDEKVAAARDLAGKLIHTLGEEGHTGVVRTELEGLLERSDSVIFHDDLSDCNQPLYVEQFVAMAAQHDLQYMFDADYVREHGLPVAIGTHSRAEERQYSDFMSARRFRESLICHAGVEVDQTIPLERLLPMVLSSRVEAEEEKPDGSQRFVLARNQAISTDNPLVKRILLSAIAAWPGSIPVKDLLPLDDPDGELGVLVRLMVSSAVEVRIEPPKLHAKVTERPVVSKLARELLAAGRGSVINQRHMEIRLADDLAMRSVALLDGTRDKAALVRDLLAEIDSGQLTLPEELRGKVGTPQFERIFQEKMEISLGMLSKLALLVA